MNYFTFRSRKAPTEFGYRVSRDTEFDYRFRGVCRWATFYQTYGDGDVQHSKEVPFSTEMLEDFLGSLACYLAECATPGCYDESMAIVAAHWPRQENSTARIRFALSLKYREDKTTYYSVGDCKTSTAESKRHDKRWDKVHDAMDGGIKGAVAVLNTGSCYDTLHSLKAWMEVCDVFGEQNDGYCPVNVWEEFKLAERGEHYTIDSAWYAVDEFVKAYRLTTDAKRRAENWAANLPGKAETV